MNKSTTFLLTLALMAMLLAACGGSTPWSTENMESEADAVPADSVAEPVAEAAVATDTAVPATATPAASPTPIPLETAEPTVAPTDTPTVTPVPAEWLTPAPHAPDVQQPDYVESPCSDRFPCNDDVAAWEARIQVPEGFEASYFAYIPHGDYPDRAAQLTSLTFGPDGLLYVATADGRIYRINEAGEMSLYVDGLIVPTGLAFQPGTEKLFVSNRVLDRNVDGEAQVSVIENGQIETLFAGLPCCYVGMHGPNGIDFGPDGYGYVGIGGRADHGEVLADITIQDELHPLEAIILRFKPDGSEMEPFAFGFRNPYDIAWDANGRLFATDNGRDGEVPDELHLVEPGGQHGYPYFECEACFGIPEGIEVIEPFHSFEPHAVATGISTYLSNEFPGYYNSLFITLWTALPFAERVVRFHPDGTMSTFATGFAAPIDLTTGPDGALYVADYATGIIFRIARAG